METQSQTNFSDIFKSSFLENAVTNFSVTDVALTIGLALLISLFIYMIYKRTFSGVMYSRNFNISLVAMCVITTFIIMGVTSNVVLSLGMVGALSIVRFRTAIKDPIDLIYLFWAVAAGIVTGAGLYLLSIVGNLIIGIILVVFSRQRQLETPYVVVAKASNGVAEEQFAALLKDNVKRLSLKSKIVRPEAGIELTYEIRVKDGQTDFINHLAQLEGIHDVALVSYNGELAA